MDSKRQDFLYFDLSPDQSPRAAWRVVRRTPLQDQIRQRRHPACPRDDAGSAPDVAKSGERQTDGRVRYWGAVVDPRDNRTRILRVVTLQDGETIHNAFFDRGFEDQAQ